MYFSFKFFWENSRKLVSLHHYRLTNDNKSKFILTMKQLRLYLIIIVLFACHLLAGAQYTFRLINTSEGLPDDEVKALFWTPDGRLGVRTSSSLSFFDGCTFHSVPPMGDEAYACDYISALPTVYVDAKQRVWMKELGQILVFDLTKDTYVRDVKGLLASMGVTERIRDFFIDSAHDFWFVTTSGKLLMVRSSLPGNLENRCKQVHVRTKGLRDVAYRQGKHWFLYADGWVVGMNEDLTHVFSKQKVWQDEVPIRDFMMLAQNKQQLWMMWNHGVATYDAHANKWQCRYQDDKAALVTLSVTPKGPAYLSIRQKGLMTIYPNGKTTLQPQLPTLDGQTLLDDIQGIAYRQGNLMLGLSGKGLCFYHPNMQRFAYVPFTALGLNQNSYRINDLANGLLFLTSDQGLFVLDALAAKATPLPMPNTDFIRGYRDSKGRVWAGSFRQGITLLEGGKIYHLLQGGIPEKDVNYDIVRGFLEDSQHHIWVNYHGGIGLFDEQQKRIVPLRLKSLDRYKVVNDFKEDALHRIWAAATQGLFVYNPANKQVLLPTSRCSCLRT